MLLLLMLLLPGARRAATEAAVSTAAASSPHGGDWCILEVCHRKEVALVATQSRAQDRVSQVSEDETASKFCVRSPEIQMKGRDMKRTVCGKAWFQCSYVI